jgi:hypothetical protein
MTKANRVLSTPPTNTSLTRRNMLGAITAAAASLPIAAAVPTVALAMAPNADAAGPVVVDPVIALAQSLIDAWNDFEEKCLVTSNAEELVIDWKNLNPRPELRAHTVGTTEDYLAFQSGLSTYDPNADLRAAVKEQEAAVKEWGKLRRSAENETGYTRAERSQKRASDRFHEIRDELTDVHPASTAGLRAKAAAARASSDENLQQQIVYDIGVLFGDLDSNEKPLA